MALLQNQRLIYQLPIRFRGGAIAFETSDSDTSSNRNKFTTFDQKCAVPNGASPDYAILTAQKSGGLSSYTGVQGQGLIVGVGAMGLGAIASLVGSGDLIGAGQLVVSAIATLTGSGIVTGNVIAALQAAASLAGTGDIVGSINAIGYAEGLLTGSGTVTLTSYAKGFVSATIGQDSAVITPQAVADAVWNGVNIEGTYTGKEILRLLASVMAGKTSISGSTATFRDINDTKDRVIATMTGSERTTVTKDVT